MNTPHTLTDWDDLLMIDGSRIAAAVISSTGVPLLSCRVRACRRAGACVGPRRPADGGDSALCWQQAYPQPIAVCLDTSLTRAAALYIDFLRGDTGGAWRAGADADAEQLETAIRAVRLCLPKRHWRRFFRFLVATGARPGHPPRRDGTGVKPASTPPVA